jgi:two-component system cell cycle sensor histidine kinase/response regulator CckA
LGLSQVDGIVKQLEGHIAVETEVGVGTTFTIYLPELPDVLLQTAVPSTQVAHGLGETILLVEDDDLVRESLQLTLEDLNYTVISVPNGLAALQIYQQGHHEFDLILTDLVMPEMGGERLLQLLKTENPSLKAVILTGYPLTADPVELQDIEALTWCQKPVTMETLSQIVADTLRHQPSEQPP